MPSSHTLSQNQINTFNEQGYLLIRSVCQASQLSVLSQTLEQHLAQRTEPLELEAELQYPGAPQQHATGDATIRRLKQAYNRADCFAKWAMAPNLTGYLKMLLGNTFYLVKAHHNCIMTKHPKYSSDSCWHQDLRYWQYSQGELISAWLALGTENRHNGALQVIPGSHRVSFHQSQFDSALFFRQDTQKNQELLKKRQLLTMEPGDLLLFHCRLLHSATRNFTDKLKTSLVFTYRKECDQPLPNSRSSESEDVRISL